VTVTGGGEASQDPHSRKIGVILIRKPSAAKWACGQRLIPWPRSMIWRLPPS